MENKQNLGILIDYFDPVNSLLPRLVKLGRSQGLSEILIVVLPTTSLAGSTTSHQDRIAMVKFLSEKDKDTSFEVFDQVSPITGNSDYIKNALNHVNDDFPNSVPVLITHPYAEFDVSSFYTNHNLKEAVSDCMNIELPFEPALELNDFVLLRKDTHHAVSRHLNPHDVTTVNVPPQVLQYIDTNKLYTKDALKTVPKSFYFKLIVFLFVPIIVLIILLGLFNL